MNKKLALLLTASTTLTSFNAPIFAQRPVPNPNQDRLIPPSELPEPLEPDVPPLQPQPSPTPPDFSEDTTPIQVEAIEISGATVFEETDFTPLTEPLEGQTVTLGQLQQLVNQINQLYLEAGYLNSVAVLPNQDLGDGTIQIQVFEGQLSNIEIEGLRRTQPNYVLSRLKVGLDEDRPLQTQDLEDQLRLLRANPLFKQVNAYLRPLNEPGQTELVVEVEEENVVTGNLFVDNYSPPSVGSIRYGADIAARSLTGWGDVLRIGYSRSTTGGSRIGTFGYGFPVNAMEGTINFNVVLDRNKITQDPFEDFNITGQSELYEVSFRQPLVRTPREEFALSVGFSYKDGQTFVFDQPTPFGIGAEADGTSTVSVFRLGQDYVSRDFSGAWALRSQFNIGADILGATTNESPIPDSRFFSWLGQVQRVQQWHPDHFSSAQFDVQLSSDSLLPSEQFTIGGGRSVRGYRSNVRSGDNGARLSLEHRWALARNGSGAPGVQVAPFFDLGWVWNEGGNPNTLARQRFIAGIGAGVLWSPVEDLLIRFDYGYPIVDLDDRGDDLTDDGLYFSVNYRF
ncbi:MAG: ShlB/FhaC/HecB family hemolysin secretion/activation protein [Cyanobacteriota bacterium]|nr:ShlB/FhaC/HecB family hemolysin secretion/activation protein [Cyanobacteriota bacterium]